MTSWSGKSRGGKFGYAFFILLIEYTNIKVTYFFLKFVAFYFLLFSNKASITFYFKEVIGYKKIKTVRSIYRNYQLLGQMLVDKISMAMGFNKNITFDFDGENHLRKMVEEKTGGLLIGAHVGNWEVAGQLLQRLEAKVNIVMYEAEHQKIKEILERKSGKVHATIIPIKDDFTHLFKITEAFNNGEIVVMHGDRFLPGTNTVTMNFMNKTAKFPCGPLYLASKNKVPVSFVFALKDGSKKYHFYATEGKTYPYPSKLKTRKQELKNMVQDYIKALEPILKKYPHQWFNYYPFWEEEKI